MMDWFRKNMRTIFLITVAGFLGGIFIGFGGYFFGGRALTNAIAEVNGKKISYRKYAQLFNRIMDNLRDKGTEITDEVIQQVRREVLQDLIQEEVFTEEAKKHGIVVTDDEVAMDIRSFPAFQKDGKFDQRTYFQIVVLQLKMTPQEFEESRRNQIAIAKLRNLITSGIKISDIELQFEYARRHNGNMSGFEKEKDKFYQELLQEKMTAFMQDWYRSINSSLKVRVFSKEFQ